MPKYSFVICVNNFDFPASLEKRKIYQVLPDRKAAQMDQVRIIDESGRDHLYPASCFVETRFPKAVEDAVVNAAITVVL